VEREYHRYLPPTGHGNYDADVVDGDGDGDGGI